LYVAGVPVVDGLVDKVATISFSRGLLLLSCTEQKLDDVRVRDLVQLTGRIPKNTLSLMNTIQTTEVFDAWFASLKDRQAMRRVQVRIDRAEDGNFGDCAPVGEGVSEMRIHYGPGYRVYFVQRGMEIVILLAGGNKSTQSKDIKAALEIARQL
jgi:putative addiction module killer protein